MDKELWLIAQKFERSVLDAKALLKTGAILSTSIFRSRAYILFVTFILLRQFMNFQHFVQIDANLETFLQFHVIRSNLQ